MVHGTSLGLNGHGRTSLERSGREWEYPHRSWTWLPASLLADKDLASCTHKYVAHIERVKAVIIVGNGVNQGACALAENEDWVLRGGRVPMHDNGGTVRTEGNFLENHRWGCNVRAPLVDLVFIEHYESFENARGRVPTEGLIVCISGNSK